MTGDSAPATAHWLLVPLVALGATLVGALAIFYGSTALADVVELGESGLGVGVWLIVAGFLTVVGSFVAGLVVGITKRRVILRPATAVRRGVVTAAYSTLAYLLAATLTVVITMFLSL